MGRPRARGTLAIGLGYLVGQWMTFGRPSWPPAEASAWLLQIAFVAMAFGIIDASWSLPKWRVGRVGWRSRARRSG